VCTASKAWFMARRRASSARRRAERVGGAAAQEEGFWVDDIGVGLGVMLVVEGLAKRSSKSSSSSEGRRGTSGIGAAADGLDMVQLIGDLD